MKNLNHIAFIMDGNRRWSKANDKPSYFGHQQGAKTIPKIILECKRLGIKYASFFAFSTENWKRSNSEIQYLLKLIKLNLNNKNLKWFKENNVNIKIIGFSNEKHQNLFQSLNDFCEKTNDYDGIYVNIFFNYGSQQEIIAACNKAILNKKEVDIESFNELLLCNIPVDLLIRTSGEKRISNFLLWQIAYAEIIFEDVFWPDYNEKILQKNLITYNKRSRRFGGNESNE